VRIKLENLRWGQSTESADTFYQRERDKQVHEEYVFEENGRNQIITLFFPLSTFLVSAAKPQGY